MPARALLPARHAPRLIGLAAFLVLVCLPRFDYADVLGIGLDAPMPGDSDQLHYIAMVEAYRGEMPAPGYPLAPFTHRPLLPLAAAALPLAPLTALNVLNVALLVAGLVALYAMLIGFGFGNRAATVGGALYVFSFPTVYYSTIGRIDPAFLGLFTLACYALAERRWVLFTAAFLLATGVRETSVLLVPLLGVALAFEGGRWGPKLLAVAALLAAYVGLSAFCQATSLDPSAPPWAPSLDRLASNAARPRAWITIPLGLSVQGALVLVGLPRLVPALGRDRMVTFALVGFAGVLTLYAYSWIVAWPDARFLWVAYPFTIPLALVVARRWVAALGETPALARSGPRWARQALA